jgi:tripartite-type tricarboxylate transporter receptor subunit TctC
MTTTRRSLLAMTGAGLTLAAIGPVAAQSYPTRLIKIVAPFPAGGPTDVLARLMADELSIALGQPVMVENRPGGAGGTLGVRVVAGAEPDGYTLLLSNLGSLTITPSIYSNLDYDPIRSFAPIAILTASPMVLVVNPAVPASSMQEFVAYAKANPGKINFASPGVGTQPHILGELFKSTAGIDMVHVPYRGAAAAITGLLAGQVQVYFETTTVLLAHIEAGTMRPLAVLSAARFPLLAAIPTSTESGFPTLKATLWSGMLAPAGTPRAVLEKLNAAINDGLRSADMQVTLKRLGAEAKGGTSQEFAAFLASEVQRWAAIIAATRIKPE